MKVLVVTILIFLLGPALTSSAAFDEPTVDIEIVLAVDASGSVDRHELKLQLDGISAAFRDRDILAVIGKGALQKVLVSVVIWSDAAYKKVTTDWFLIDTPQSAELFAKRVETFAIRHGALTPVGTGGTGLGSGLAFALAMIENNNVVARRRIVDVSGDGRETVPWIKNAITLPQARLIAKSQKVTVNGLAIETDVPDLTAYYRNNVLVGPGSFAMSAVNFRDYARAIKKKLLRELSPAAIGNNNSKNGITVSSICPNNHHQAVETLPCY